MIGTYKEVKYILHRKFRRKNVDVDTNMEIRKASRNIETPPKSPQDKKSEYTNMYTPRRVGVSECRRKNAQGNYEPLSYGHNASRRQLSGCLQIRGRYLQRGSTKDLVYTASRKNEREERSRDRKIAKKQLQSHERVRI